MKKTGLILMAVMMLMTIPAWGDKLLTIDSRRTIQDDQGDPNCSRCFTSGRAKEQLLNLRRETPYSLPKAALPADLVDTITIMAIRVDFTYEEPDDPTTTSRGHFDLRDTAAFLAAEGHALDPAPHNRHYFEAHMRSLAQFYNIASNGRLQLVYEVWPQSSDSAYHLTHAIGHYGSQLPNRGLGEFFHDALDAIYGAEGDSLSFRDERGKRKAIMIFHAGADRQTDLWFSATPTPNDLYTGFLTFEGDNRWFLDPDTTIIGEDIFITGRDTIVEGVIMPETMTQDNRVTCMNAVIAHEFGHQLGLIDLYNTGSSPFLTQMGDFALMDNMGMNTAAYIGEYGVGAFGTVPVFPMAWSRAYLGFDEVVEYTKGTSIELAAVKMKTDGVKIAKIPISSTEYYLMENRRSDVDGPVGLRQDSLSNVILWPARYDPDGDSIMALREYDLYLPIGSEGIAIWHIDELVAAMDYVPDTAYTDGLGIPIDGFSNNFDANRLQWDSDRRFVSLVEADGMIDFGGNYYRGFGTPRDLFYAGNNTAFGSYTNPPTISNDGGYSHVNITNISAPGMIMTFDLNREQMANNFPRRISIPVNPNLPAISADLDGNGEDEILAVSGKRILAMTVDGHSYIDPDGNWDSHPRNIDTIFSGIQSVTDANSRKPIDTTYALMPVFADDAAGVLTTPPVVASFNDTTLVLVGDANGVIYSYLPDDSAAAQPSRARLFKIRQTRMAGAVRAILPDPAHGSIIGIYEDGKYALAPWNVSGIVNATYDFESPFAGACSYKEGRLLLFDDGSNSYLYMARDIPLGWPADSLVIHGISMNLTGFHTPIATDFNRDGNDEVVLVSPTGRIFTFTCGAEELTPYEALFDVATNDTAAAGPVTGDVTGNGYPELILPGTNCLYGFDRNGVVVTDFPMILDYGRPNQLVITPPIISDLTGDDFPDMAVTAFDSVLHTKYWGNVDIYPDTANYPDSFYTRELNYDYHNYFSNVYVVSPGVRRIEGFPVSSGAYGIRLPGDTVIGAGSALHLEDGNKGLLVTTGADGWLNAWECEWSDDAALWPMAGRTSDGSGYLPLEALGSEVVLSDFLPESKFYNYPNPATGRETTIRFYVNQPAAVTITIIDAVGDEIWKTEREVSDGNSENEVAWALDGVASGVYHCRLEATALSGSESKVVFKTIAVVK